MAEEIEIGIRDIKHGGTDYDIQGALQFALAIIQVPASLKTCKNMGDDITAIEQWAMIFRDPKTLAKHLATHYALHKKAITTDIQSLESDWEAQLYFKAGQDLADLATLAIGPIETEAESMVTSTVGDDAAAAFAAGYLFGVERGDKFSYILSCFTTDTELNQILDDIMADYAKGDTKSGDAGWDLAEPRFKIALTPCTDVAAEFNALDQYTQDVLARPDAEDFINARALEYEDIINFEGGEMIYYWNIGNYFYAG